MTAIISAVLSMMTALLPLITSSGNATMIESGDVASYGRKNSR